MFNLEQVFEILTVNISPPTVISVPLKFLVVTVMFIVSPTNIVELSKPVTTEYVLSAVSRNLWSTSVMLYPASFWIVFSIIMKRKEIKCLWANILNLNINLILSK